MIYLFKCGQCGKRFNTQMSVGEYSVTFINKCPNCNSDQTNRIFEPTVVIYKGNDFTKSVKEEE